jgi:hypothetical protein
MRATRIHLFVVGVFLLCVWTGLGWAQALRVVGFNAESGGARPDVVEGERGRDAQRQLDGSFRPGPSWKRLAGPGALSLRAGLDTAHGCGVLRLYSRGPSHVQCTPIIVDGGWSTLDRTS